MKEEIQRKKYASNFLELAVLLCEKKEIFKKKSVYVQGGKEAITEQE